MSVRTGDGNTIATTREHVGSRSAPRHITRTCDRHSAVRALGAAQAELRDGPALSRLDHTGGLGRHEGLKPDDVKQGGLKQLAIEHGAAHAHHGLAREHELALGDGVDIHLRTKAVQELEEAGFKQGTATRSLKLGQIRDVLIREPEVLDELPNSAVPHMTAKELPKGASRKNAVKQPCSSTLPLSHRPCAMVSSYRSVFMETSVGLVMSVKAMGRSFPK